MKTQTKVSSVLTKKLEATKSTIPHLIVLARAGTGKTTTLIEGLKYLRGEPTVITPSEQQMKIWECISLSNKNSSVCFTAFNASIAETLKSKVPVGVTAATNHSLGMKIIGQTLGRFKVDKDRVYNLTDSVLLESKDSKVASNFVLQSYITKLVNFARTNLLDLSTEVIDSYLSEEIESLTELDSVTEGLVYEYAPEVFERCKTPQIDKSIDFLDMIWLPCVLNLPCPKYDILMVDESQDLNRCQQVLTQKMGRRLIYVGDDRQAIYGFAGADSRSLNTLRTELENTSQGLTVLPLTTTYRCGKSIVKEAKTIVKEFEAHESNSEGTVKSMSILPMVKDNYYMNSVKPGDMVLCRLNAILVKECLTMLKKKIPAVILGRNIINELFRVIDKVSGNDQKMKTSKFQTLLETWLSDQTEKESRKKDPSEKKIQKLNDICESLLCFSEECSTVKEMREVINNMFTDTDTKNVITLSTIHKAKGLEAKTVFLLKPENAPCPFLKFKGKGANIEQEYNLFYVAVTRAIDTLVYVS